ncbi:MAG: hypothetical protein XD62_0001, partial [Methanosarcinales archeaon 56_1174]
ESKLAAEQVRATLSRYAREALDVEVKGGRATVHASKGDIPRLIGRGGRNIERLEHELGMHIDVREREDELPHGGFELEGFRVTKRSLVLVFSSLQGKDVDVFVGDDYLFSATVRKKGEIKVPKNSDIARQLREALDRGLGVWARPI